MARTGRPVMYDIICVIHHNSLKSFDPRETKSLKLIVTDEKELKKLYYVVNADTTREYVQQFDGRIEINAKCDPVKSLSDRIIDDILIGQKHEFHPMSGREMKCRIKVNKFVTKAYDRGVSFGIISLVNV